MKTLALIICTFLFIATVCAQNKRAVDKLHFMSIAKRNNRCVIISGLPQSGNTLFIDSCPDRSTIKEISSDVWVHDMNFFSDNSGWMIVGFSLVKVDNKRLLPLPKNLGTIENE
jgi:hypothetical protein